MKFLILFLFFGTNLTEPGAKMFVKDSNEAAVIVWQQGQRALTTGKLFEVTIAPAGVVEMPLPTLTFTPPAPPAPPRPR